MVKMFQVNQLITKMQNRIQIIYLREIQKLFCYSKRCNFSSPVIFILEHLYKYCIVLVRMGKFNQGGAGVVFGVRRKTHNKQVHLHRLLRNVCMAYFIRTKFYNREHEKCNLHGEKSIYERYII